MIDIDMDALSKAVQARLAVANTAELALTSADMDRFLTDVHLDEHTPRLDDYDVILANNSGGKDSQAKITYLVWLADRQGVAREKILVVHCDLGRVEWPGTAELARAQATAYGLRFVTVRRDEDLLDQIVSRHNRLRAKGDTTTPAWPSSAARYCTSDQKTSQVTKLMTLLSAEHTGPGRVRILNCLGIRAGESSARAKKVPFGPDPATWSITPRAARPATRTQPAVEAREGIRHGRRHVDRWLPIFDWTTEQVWQAIHLSTLPYHPAYDLPGISRLSCVFCVLAPREQLIAGARANPGLARQYLGVEQRVVHTFKRDLSMAEITAAAEAAGPLSLPGGTA